MIVSLTTSSGREKHSTTPFTVERSMNLTKMLICDVRIDLRRGDIRVAEEGLNAAQIGTVL